jgi:haloalkane dehalogenase
MIPADETFEGTFPFPANFTKRPGFAMHYLDEGSGEPVVLVHGEPTWGYLWRHLIPALAAERRVVVPDHMGFGKSETPADRTYDAREHVDNLEALLVDELDLEDMTLVLHDWGATIGGRLALRHPDRVRRLVVLDSAMEFGLPGELAGLADTFAASRWFNWIGEALPSGAFDAVFGHLDMTVLHVMVELQGIVDSAAITPAMVRAYASAFAGPGECRGGIAFPRQLVEGTRSPEDPDPAAVAALRAKPAMLIYGQQDRALPPVGFERIFAEQYPEAPIVRLAHSGHFPPEDQPEAVLAALQAFLGLT